VAGVREDVDVHRGGADHVLGGLAAAKPEADMPEPHGGRITWWLLGLALCAAGCGDDLRDPTGVGESCIPSDEYDSAFSGYSAEEMNLDFGPHQCATNLCLVNHFQGRVSCPYGQTMADVQAGTPGCVIPGRSGPHAGDPVLVPVAPQLLGRRPDRAVYCSCRCANAQGKTNDGAAYCDCPDGYGCAQLLPNLDLIGPTMTGGFCIKQGTDYKSTDLAAGICDPASKDCGPAR
jgi:hypothetical protein